MYLFWSLRLSGHLVTRLSTVGEDPRYERLKASWGKQARLKLLGYFGLQALLNVFFTLPLFILWSDPSAEYGGLRKFATILWLACSWAEGRSDRQLDRFKRDPKNKGKTCRAGFWKYSRHPNYFFEWMIWISYALYAWPSPQGPLALLCPLAMLAFLFKLTGIPANEAQALKTRGKDYQLYQETTSAFFPCIPGGRAKKKK
jgi:steroid 5-alpha reductase family enzyme